MVDLKAPFVFVLTFILYFHFTLICIFNPKFIVLFLCTTHAPIDLQLEANKIDKSKLQLNTTLRLNNKQICLFIWTCLSSGCLYADGDTAAHKRDIHRPCIDLGTVGVF